MLLEKCAELGEKMSYILHYDIAAMVLAVVILIHFYHKKSIRMPQSFAFVWLIWLSLLTDIVDILTVVLDEIRFVPWVVYLVNVIYLSLFNTLPFLYYLYLYISTGKDRSKWGVRDLLVLFAPLAVSVLMIMTSPVTGFVFHYTQADGYQHGIGFLLLYVATGYYMVATLVTTARYRAVLTKWQITSVCLYLTASLIGIVIQALIPHALVLQFSTSLSLLLLYMALESPDGDEDKFLGVYNRRGFDKVVSSAVRKQEKFHLLIINVTNFQSLREAVGLELGKMLLKEAVEKLKTEIRPMELFYLADGRLAIFVEDDKEKLDYVVDILRNRIGQGVISEDMNLQLETVLIQMDYPEEVKTVEDIMDAIDYSAMVSFEQNDGQALHVGEEILAKRKRELQIQHCMQRALKQGTFQVYYQPIYSSTGKRYHSAEALIRLFDPELGFISPEEFIPMAERNGMILKIGEFVFRTVCEMMAREKIWEKGIDFIEVNLSVVQCMQEDICEMLYGIMDEYGIPYDRINLEVTETTMDEEVLWNAMERMTVGGVTFSLDDYGTGYSNLCNVLKHPFHIIKLDKSMVWYAMENENAMCALRHTAAMIRDIHMHIVAEGVETEQQQELLTEMGCEYLQGYYFSKPVPEREFLAKIKSLP